MLLYKYRSPINNFSPANTEKCNTAKIFSGSALYYAKSTTLNDPYEAHIEFDFSAPEEKALNSHFRVLRERDRLRGSGSGQLHQTMKQAQRNVASSQEIIEKKSIDFQAYYREVMDHHGLLSLSEESNNLLMWAHYGAEHAGICLGFQWDETGLPAARRVDYHSAYQLVDYWSYTEDELAEIACFQKSIDWAYEREWRSFSHATYESYDKLELTSDAANALKQAEAEGDTWSASQISNDHTFRYRRPKDFGYKAIKFEKGSLKEVIFGAKMSDQAKKEHAKYVTALGYAPSFLHVVRHRQLYALELREWKP